MITAMQSSRIKVTAALMTARNALLSDVLHSICCGPEDYAKVHAALANIDSLLADLIPNEPLGEKQ